MMRGWTTHSTQTPNDTLLHQEIIEPLQDSGFLSPHADFGFDLRGDARADAVQVVSDRRDILDDLMIRALPGARLQRFQGSRMD